MKSKIIFICLVFVSCSQTPQEKNNKKEEIISVKFPLIASETNKEVLIKNIESSYCLMGKGIGLTGEENLTYIAFARLNQLLHDSDWVRLSFSKSPVMRVYAYNALKDRNKSIALDLKKRLSVDTTSVCFINNDIKGRCTVGFYINSTSN